MQNPLACVEELRSPPRFSSGNFGVLLSERGLGPELSDLPYRQVISLAFNGDDQPTVSLVWDRISVRETYHLPHRF